MLQELTTILLLSLLAPRCWGLPQHISTLFAQSSMKQEFSVSWAVWSASPAFLKLLISNLCPDMFLCTGMQWAGADG